MGVVLQTELTVRKCSPEDLAVGQIDWTQIAPAGQGTHHGHVVPQELLGPGLGPT